MSAAGQNRELRKILVLEDEPVVAESITKILN